MNQQIIECLPELAIGDAWLTHRGRLLDVNVILAVGEDQFLIRIRMSIQSLGTNTVLQFY